MKENKEKSSHKTNNGDGKGKNNDTKGEQKKKGKIIITTGSSNQAAFFLLKTEFGNDGKIFEIRANQGKKRNTDSLPTGIRIILSKKDSESCCGTKNTDQQITPCRMRRVVLSRSRT